jgi:hypothetical protein
VSHFSVLVRVPASVVLSSLEEAVGQLMLPYKEAHCGADDPPELTQYLVFHDIEDEYLHKYQTETSSLVRLADGTVLSAYDDRLRNPELFGRPQFLVPADATAFEMPHRQQYATFEAFMDDYCGHKERDPRQGRYGYWQNTNQWIWVDVEGEEIGRTFDNEILPGLREDKTSGLFLPVEERESGQVHLLHTMRQDSQPQTESRTPTFPASQTEVQPQPGAVQCDVDNTAGPVCDLRRADGIDETERTRQKSGSCGSLPQDKSSAWTSLQRMQPDVGQGKGSSGHTCKSHPVSFPVRRYLISGRKWDYWTVGGSWTAFFRPDYDPAKDPANQETCFLCGGTGVRTHRPPPDSPPSWPVLGVSCNGCEGTGRRLVFPTKFRPVGNYTRLAALDLDRLHQEALERLDSFWKKWESFCFGQHQEDEGLRANALRMGLLEVKEQSELTGAEWKVIPWDTPETPPEECRHRCDVLVPTTREWLLAHYLDLFHPLYTHARLDASGWQEPGRMGWFASLDTTPVRMETYARDLRPWLQHGDSQDWLVIVDAHI